MSVFAIALRVLLSFILVLDGFGSAAASGHRWHTAATYIEMPVSAVVAQPCHGDAQDAAELADARLGLGEKAPSHSQPDCCQSAGCQCSCAHHGQSAIPTRAWGEAAQAKGNAVFPLALAHGAPSLRQLIRPPIG